MAKSHNQFHPFLRLPPEIRNKIYALSITHALPIMIHARWLTPGLLQVNRQIRSEALAIYYTDNEFLLLREFAVPWLECRSPEARNHLKRVKLSTTEYEMKRTFAWRTKSGRDAFTAIREMGLGEVVRIEMRVNGRIGFDTEMELRDLGTVGG